MMLALGVTATVSHHPQMGPPSCSGLPLILHYGELYNNFIIYHNVVMIEIKDTVNVIRLSHPETTPSSPVWGRIVFHETGPCCQKGWGPLL